MADITGTGGDDSILGTGADDVINAGAGSDVVSAGAGADVVSGDKGPARGVRTIPGEGGTHTLLVWDLANISVSGVDFLGFSKNPFLNSTSGLSTLKVKGGTFTIDGGTTPIGVGVNDNDSYFNDGDLGQKLANNETINGVFENAGDRFTPEYAYTVRPAGSTSSADVITIYVAEFGSNKTVGILSDKPLQAGADYEFIANVSHYPKVNYADLADTYLVDDGAGDGSPGDDIINGGAGDDIIYGDLGPNGAAGSGTVQNEGGDHTLLVWDLANINVSGVDFLGFSKDPFLNSTSGLHTSKVKGGTFTIAGGTTPVGVGVNDNDSYFNDGDLSQKLANNETINGVFENAGDRFTPEYAYTVRPAGSTSASDVITIYVAEFGSNKTVGILSDKPLEAGVDYEFIANVSHYPKVRYSELADTYIVPGQGGDVESGPNDGDDILNGDGGDDTIYGQGGSDTIAGGEGADQLFGNDDDDDITVGAGDVAQGGSGDDEFFVDPSLSGAAPITVIGGETGEDLTDPTNGGAGDTLDLRGLDDVTVNFDDNDPEAGVATYTNDDGETVSITFSEIENVLTDAPVELTIEVDPTTPVNENGEPVIPEDGGVTSITITRSGPTDEPLTVTLTSSDTTEATVPATVTIPAGADSITVPVSAVDDPIVDGDQTPVITASAPGIAPVSTPIVVEDDDVAETPVLTIEPAPGTPTDENGDPLTAENGAPAFIVVSRTGPTDEPLTVTLGSDDPSEATVPTTVTIPAGQDSVIVPVTPVDDADLDGDQTPIITASAPGFDPVATPVTVADDEEPAEPVLTIEPAPGTPTDENGDPLTAENGAPAFIVVSRTGPTDEPLTVTLESDDPSEAAVPTTVTIPAGQSSVIVPVTPVDDADLDGDQTPIITATAPGFDPVETPVTVADDEEPAEPVLTIEPAPGTPTDENGDPLTAENGAPAFIVVSRTGPTDEPLTVTLGSDDPSEATVPTTVTIPAGQSSVIVPVTPVDDSEVDGDQTPVITATAPGFDPVSTPVTVADDDVPTDGVVDGTPGDDEMRPGYVDADGDQIDGDDGLDDVIEAGDGDDIVDGGFGDDIIDAGDGADIIDGGPGSDLIDAGAGDDDILMGPGDTVNGGSGDDEFYVDPGQLGDGPITVIGGEEGEDLTDPTNGGDGDVLDLRGLDDVVVTFDPTDPEAGVATYTDDDGDTITINFSEIETVLTDEDPVDPELTITLDPTTPVDENGRPVIGEDGGLTSITITRSGPTDEPLTITLGSDDPTEATVPTTVTIPAGQDSVTVPIAAVDDDLVDGDQVPTITATAPGFAPVTLDVVVEDDDVPASGVVDGTPGDDEMRPGYVDADGDQIDGDDGLDDVIEAGDGDDIVDGGFGDDIIDAGDGADIIDGGPGSDLIDAGAGDDDILMGPGDTVNGGSGDDEFYVDPGQLGDGPITVIGGEEGEDLTDPTNGGDGDVLDLRGLDDVVVTFDPTDPEAGVATYTDDDGDTITINFSEIETVLTDEDPVDPELTITLDPTTPVDENGRPVIGEDGGLTSITITRSGPTDEPLTITLGSDDPTEATVPTTVTIPAGQDSVTVPIAAVDDDLVDGDQVPTITATAPGFAPVTLDVVVEDDDVPASGVVDGTDDGQEMRPGFTDVDGDRIDGEDGLDDIIEGNGGDDVIDGGFGDDVIYAGDGSDILDGGEGEDLLDGGADDDDFLIAGGDTALGGSGDDEFYIDASKPETGDITVIGGEEGEDLSDPTNGGDGDVLDLQGLADVTVEFDDFDPEAGVATYVNDDGATVTINFSEIETVKTDGGNGGGGGGEGIVDGTDDGEEMRPYFTDADGDQIDGDDGLDDVIEGYGGDDIIDGGFGDDEIYAGDGSDILDGGEGNDLLDGGRDDDDFLIAGGDIAFGGKGDDEFYIDTSKPETGDITVIGGEGGEDLSDPTNGGDGDVLDLRWLPNVTVDFDPSDPEAGVATYTNDDGATVTINFSEIETVLTDDGVGGGGKTGDGVVDGTDGADFMGPGYVDDNGDVIDGEDGDDDVVEGKKGGDVIDGGEGDDVINGGKDDDYIEGGNGDDVIYGGYGSDEIYGGEGRDRVIAGDGDDVVETGSGAGYVEYVDLGEGQDTLIFSAGSGHDVVKDFSAADDVVDLRSWSGLDFAGVQAAASQDGDDVDIQLSDDDAVTLENVTVEELTEDNFLLS